MTSPTINKRVTACTFSLMLSAGTEATELLNSSNDVSREPFAALNAPFEQPWAQQHAGDTLTIKQSHAGCARQALAILPGLKADVVTYNQIADVQILHDRGRLIPADRQQRLPHASSPSYSTIAFLVRKGNPRNIDDWDDLVRDDVKLTFPNPKTSGNGRDTWVAAARADGADKVKTENFITRLLQNVGVSDTAGRGATTSFVERGVGDVASSFASAVNTIRDRYQQDGCQVIVPPTTILAQQKYRFPHTELFRVEQVFARWDRVMKTHFASGGERDKLLAARRE